MSMNDETEGGPDMAGRNEGILDAVPQIAAAVETWLDAGPAIGATGRWAILIPMIRWNRKYGWLEALPLHCSATVMPVAAGQLEDGERRRLWDGVLANAAAVGLGALRATLVEAFAGDLADGQTGAMPFAGDSDVEDLADVRMGVVPLMSPGMVEQAEHEPWQGIDRFAGLFRSLEGSSVTMRHGSDDVSIRSGTAYDSRPGSNRMTAMEAPAIDAGYESSLKGHPERLLQACCELQGDGGDAAGGKTERDISIRAWGAPPDGWFDICSMAGPERAAVGGVGTTRLRFRNARRDTAEEGRWSKPRELTVDLLDTPMSRGAAVQTEMWMA